jgi:hypothetical protein
MSSVFDGLDNVFVAAFGEPVVYTPQSTGVPLGPDGTISAIWIDVPGFAVHGEADTDTTEITLHLRAADVAAPAEGDTARRVKDGRTCKVVPPIRPDGKGMIAVSLEAIAQ